MSVYLYTAILEELAYNGYIIAAIDHTYEGIRQVFPDGIFTWPEYEKFQPGGGMGRVTAAEVLEFYKRRVKIRYDDVLFVLDNTDTLNISYGNPALHPQLIHSVSFQNRIDKDKIFSGISLTDSYSEDKVISIARYNKTTGVTSTTRENLGKELLLSLNGNIIAGITKAWTLSVITNIVYISIKNISQTSQQNNGISGNLNFNNTYKINSKLTASAFWGYFRPGLLYKVVQPGWYFITYRLPIKYVKKK